MGNDFMRMIDPNNVGLTRSVKEDPQFEENFDDLSIKDKVQKVYNDFVSLKCSIDEKHEWDSLTEIVSNVTNILNFVVEVWSIIQALGFDIDEVMLDPKKRKQFGKVLDDMIVLNGVAEMVDGVIISTLLDHASEIYVSKFRDKLNKMFVKR